MGSRWGVSNADNQIVARFDTKREANDYRRTKKRGTLWTVRL